MGRADVRAETSGDTDEQLLARYAATDRSRSDREAAFHELVSRYQRRVFAVCAQVLGAGPDAEDATQETFVRLARNADTFRGDAKLSTWLYRVARNVCVDHVRRDARRPSTPVDDVTAVADEPTADDVLGARETAMTVQDALAQLDELSRTLLLLVAVEGLTYAEAAEAAGLAVGTVKSRVSRARVRLGELLIDRSDAPTGARGDDQDRRTRPGATDPMEARGPPG